MRILRRLAVVTAALVGVWATGIAVVDTDFPYVKGDLIIWLSPSTTLAQAESFALANSLVVKRVMRTPGLFQMALATIPGDAAAEKAALQSKLNTIRTRPEVQLAGLNQIFEKHQNPNDPLFGAAANRQWNLFQIGLPFPGGAWSVEKGQAGVLVVNLDSDFDINHNDFLDAANNPRMIAPYYAGNATTNVLPPFPPTAPGNPNGFSHGTMTASAIISGTNNARGMAGVAWQGVQMIPVRIGDDQGGLTSVYIYDGFQYVIDWNNNPLNPKIVAQNMSFGGGGQDPIQRQLLDTIAAQGTLLCASSGNSRQFGIPAGFPASFPNVISVAATRSSIFKGIPTTYSSFGLANRTRKVDLAAPSADPDGGGNPVWMNWYGGGADNSIPGGTSYSCPEVVGAIALLYSAGMRIDTIFNNLKLTAVPGPGAGPSPNVDTGWGEIDVQGAMSLVTTGFKGLEPKDNTTVEYQTVKFNFRSFRITTVTNVTVQRVSPAFGPVVVAPINYTVTVDPNDNRVRHIVGEARLDAGANDGDGDWVITINGTDAFLTAFSATRNATVKHKVILAGKNMIGLPYDLGGSASPPNGRRPEEFFAPGFELWRWVPDGSGAGSYALYDPTALPANNRNFQDAGLTPNSNETVETTQSGATRIETALQGPYGVGFWLNTGSDTKMTFERGPSTGVYRYRIRLKKGWNQVGNPYSFPVDWAGCTIETIPAQQLYTITQAGAQRIIKPQIYRYEILLDGSKAYTWASPPAGQFRPFESHWIYAEEECYVEITPTPALLRGRAATPTVRGEGWLVKLGARQGNVEDPNNFIGLTKNVNPVFDQVADPPTSPEGVNLSVIKQGSASLAQDVREISSGRETWQIVVVPAKPNEDVVVTWNQLVTPSKRVRLTLTDTVTSRSIAMQKNGTYTFKSDESMSPRQMVITSVPDTACRLVIGSVRVAGNSRGGGNFSINYNLSSDANVTIQVLGNNGKKVAALESRSRSAGTNAASWNGRDSKGMAVAPGVYMIQITAETTNGERARTTTPITVTR